MLVYIHIKLQFIRIFAFSFSKMHIKYRLYTVICIAVVTLLQLPTHLDLKICHVTNTKSLNYIIFKPEIQHNHKMRDVELNICSNSAVELRKFGKFASSENLCCSFPLSPVPQSS